MNRARIPGRLQQGASLIEVMVAMLLLSFGMLSLGSMLSFAIQSPKLSGYRATAANLASSHIERIRANPGGFAADDYASSLSYDGKFGAGCAADCTDSQLASLQARCNYPDCTPLALSTMDTATARQAVRTALPAGGMMLKCDPAPCSAVASSYGNLWIVWQEPRTHATLDPASTDNCPAEVTDTYHADPKPRCLYVRFKV